MMTDLFSSLDGSYTFWSWGISILFCSIFMVNLMWSLNSTTILTNMVFSFWNMNESYTPTKLFLGSIMFFLILNNLIGLTPYTYGVTSSLWVNSSFALLLWALLLFSGWFKYPKESAAHLAPAGAPTALIPFLVLIETISIVIRPLTLTVRLVANISAGHIVLSLIANCLSSLLNFFPQSMLILVLIGYMLFEVFVSFIQAYIFTLLISLYAAEHPSKYSSMEHLTVN